MKDCISILVICFKFFKLRIEKERLKKPLNYITFWRLFRCK